MARKSTFEWIIEKTENYDEIDSVDILDQNLLQISRDDGEVIIVTTISNKNISLADIKSLIEKNDANFILHTKKDPFICGSVYVFLEGRSKIIGSFGDLFRVLKESDISNYLHPQTKFITRGLNQHDKVIDITRIDNKRYEIKRYNLPSVTIIALDDYDIGLESIRSAIENYGEFDAVLKANPNGKITESAYELAESKNFKILKWGELMGKLNLKWNWKK
ncbi:hypothetical protein [Christiangramia sp. OXR-203]|uniref:hypothetical protein n=1 Tax=Christiangramia sp. OXR-203 TaxID=3100176 RepID=UPI002AC94EFF|nr:hypothetical protein [Christiangramia sp. OXR-203]WPY97621.1 hypothetical protein T8I65_10590 [Christiangramia sp. OXR-203]